MILTIILLSLALLVLLCLAVLQKVTLNQLEEELDLADQLEAVKDMRIQQLRKALDLPADGPWLPSSTKVSYERNIPRPEDYPSRGKLRRAHRRPDTPSLAGPESALLPDWARLPPDWEWAD